MRIVLSLAVLGPLLAFGQPAPPSIERSTLRLHYVQKPIGFERYEIAPDGDLSRRSASGAEAEALKLTADFDFTDRGGRVQLAATLRVKPDFTPISFQAKGKSYRFVNVDSEVRVQGSDAVVRADGAVESRVTLRRSSSQSMGTPPSRYRCCCFDTGSCTVSRAFFVPCPDSRPTT